MTLLDNSVIGGTARSGQPGRVAEVPQGTSGPPAPLGAPAPGGDTHREAPESVSSVQGNPMGAADLSEIRRSRIGQTPGRRPEADLLTEGRGGWKRAGGIAATPVAASMRDEVLRRGTPQDLRRSGGRRHGEDGGLRAVRRLGVLLLEILRARGADTPRQGTASGAATRPAQRPKWSWIGERTPWTAAALEAAKRTGREPSRR